jgi:large conductance mechanosensitive channel
MSSKEHQEKMIEELKGIRELLTPKPATAPPPPPKKTFSQEFMDFLNKYGVIGLAIGFIIGGAAGALVSALVSDLFMPIITFFLPKDSPWQTYSIAIGNGQLLIGHFFSVLINFIVIALIVFMLIRPLSKTGFK